MSLLFEILRNHKRKLLSYTVLVVTVSRLAMADFSVSSQTSGKYNELVSILASSPKTLDEKSAVVRAFDVKLVDFFMTLTNRELEAYLQADIDKTLQERTHLPGLMPRWNATSVQELANDFRHPERKFNGKLGNIISNIGFRCVMALDLFQKEDKPEFSGELPFNIWKRSALHHALYKELQTRLENGKWD